ncbi:ATP-binding response regulator [Echinicola salinicaeni]|uniref:ATP-binding response regulator n=1 Tax=Echinicola salinicaeni TaxID=2762757 RepID=UPI001647BC1A|nr:ATP-binding protein [Echinicola salinicaeni]
MAQVSHEIRTPLHAIIGLTEELGQTSLDGDQRNLVENLLKTERILMNLVNDVLDYTKLKAEGFTIRNKTAVLPDLMNEISMLFESLAKKNSTDIVVQCDTASPKVLIDVLRIKQVIGNLVNNALKFTNNGRITIRCRQLNSRAENKNKYRFEVSDTGPGIPTGYEAKIFEEYGQTKEGKQKNGTGLGLTISNKILKKMDSKLKVKSVTGKNKGKESGATFYFDLYLEPSELPVDDKKKKLIHSFHGKKALLIDDDILMQEVTSRMLEKENIQTTVSGTLKEAKSLLLKNEYDLLLVDMHLEDGKGTDILEFCESNKIRTGPVVIISAFIPESENQTISKANAILNKPFNGRALKRALSTVSNIDELKAVIDK